MKRSARISARPVFLNSSFCMNHTLQYSTPFKNTHNLFVTFIANLSLELEFDVVNDGIFKYIL